MPVLTSQQRKLLDDACVKGRRSSEQAVRAALGSLAVTAERPPAHLNEADRQLRRGLRAKSRQLGDQGDQLDLLIAECAYEQWHRLLFARFLAENNLLIDRASGAPVTIEDCEELADSLGEPDGWAVAGRFAAEILPGIFRLDDPCVQLRLAPEGRLALEGIVAGLPAGVFAGDDALGWVYQFWQREQKDEVNASERKIGGADLGPVTQLFTENYMVRFLLENSLGAWWAGRHPDSPLVKEFDYLRLDEDGRPAAGAFDAWPERVAAVTVMDPCCGSGHFLVEAFSMLWQMRAEEDGLSPVTAQDAVLRDNIFGLELDPRCVQIAMFAVALQAWKAGGGWRPLTVPNIACSGIPVKAPPEEWKALGRGDERLENALMRLHALFRRADELGSLIAPRHVTDEERPDLFEYVEWEQIAPLLEQAAAREPDDPAHFVLGKDAAGLAVAAALLSRRYTMISTNVPYLQKGRQSQILRAYAETYHRVAREDLATIFVHRCLQLLEPGGVEVVVTPRTWFLLGRYRNLRELLLEDERIEMCTQLGARAFAGISGEVVNVGLVALRRERPTVTSMTWGCDVSDAATPTDKSKGLRHAPLLRRSQADLLRNPDARFVLDFASGGALLAEHAEALGGTTTGDSPRFRALFWEVDSLDPQWTKQQGPPDRTAPFCGREYLLRWEQGQGRLVKAAAEGATIAGRGAWGRSGIAVRYTGDLPVTLYSGDLFENVIAVIVPRSPDLVPAIWHFCSSPDYARSVREIDHKIGVTANTLAKVPFDIDHWRRVAEEAGPLPEPHSDDPTQWLFEGAPVSATEPLQVAVARLLDYRWPEQPGSDELDAYADKDGIVCLPSVLGERTAADRVQEILARAFGGTWSPQRTQQLLAGSGSTKKDVDSWLREEFFKAHCQVFKSRPFIWQLWDGRKDGFSALVNYHKLDRPTLEKLTYSYLGDWIERQTAGVRDDAAGAEERVAAARTLQRKLELILEGEPPYDIYVRWKSLAEQPIGWEPDLNDGVRLNIRPFVEAGVLRSKVNVKWDKDRGKNPDGSDRLNDLHYTNAQKQAARGSSA
jgi:hypothetical protein